MLSSDPRALHKLKGITKMVDACNTRYESIVGYYKDNKGNVIGEN